MGDTHRVHKYRAREGNPKSKLVFNRRSRQSFDTLFLAVLAKIKYEMHSVGVPSQVRNHGLYDPIYSGPR